ncbi:MAG: hypothetical protein M1826_000126 [Phylliscum demangeonii]|nr:MAG: hypothetical protein M1826_000126 [Phylliscum demangeonii]
MKLVLYLLPLYAFNVSAGRVYIPPDQLEHESYELARPNTLLTSADRAGKKKNSWPPHIVEPRVQNLATLAKRTTDEENPHSQEDANPGTNARRIPISYTSEQLTAYQEEYIAAERASTNLGEELAAAKAAGLEVSHHDEDELSRLNQVTYQQRLDVSSLTHDLEIQKLAKSGVYSVQQLAEYKRNFLDALAELCLTKSKLAKVVKMRKVTKVEGKGLADLQRAYNLHRKTWDRVRQDKPADYRVDRPKKSMDDLLESAKLREIAQSSGYSVQELAETQRRYLDSNNQANAFKRELTGVERLQKARWDRMMKGERDDPAVPPPPKVGRQGQNASALRQTDPASLPITYTPKQIAMYDKQHLAALDDLNAFRNKVSAAERRGRPLTDEEEEQLRNLQDVYNQRWAEWDRVAQGPSVDGLSEDRRSATYTAEQIAAYNQDHLDALGTLRAFLRNMAAAGHPPTSDDKVQYRALRDDYNKKKTIWTRAQDDEPVDSAVRTHRGARSVPKSARSPKSRPGGQAQASQASPAKENPSTTHQPLQISNPRHLLAPVLSSASHFFQGLGRRWRAMPWTRYLVNPRLNMAKPAELLRAERALP